MPRAALDAKLFASSRGEDGRVASSRKYAHRQRGDRHLAPTASSNSLDAIARISAVRVERERNRCRRQRIAARSLAMSGSSRSPEAVYRVPSHFTLTRVPIGLFSLDGRVVAHSRAFAQRRQWRREGTPHTPRASWAAHTHARAAGRRILIL